MKKIIFNLLLFFLVMILLGLMGQQDYEQEIQDAETYKNMVCDGYWPDYKNLELDCDKE